MVSHPPGHARAIWKGAAVRPVLIGIRFSATSLIGNRPVPPPREMLADMEIKVEITVGVPADDAWTLVGERFGEVATWASAITASSLDGSPRAGAVRTCQIGGFGPIGGGEIRERLLGFAPGDRSLSYEADGLPSFITRAVNRWSVHPVDDQTCTVRIHATLILVWPFRPFGGVLRWRMRRDLAEVLEELVHRLETGAAHPRKLAAHAGGARGPETTGRRG